MKVALGFCCALLLAVGCGPNNPAVRMISSQPVAGKVGGQTWTAGTAEVALVRTDAAMQYQLALYAASFAPCAAFAPRLETDRVTLLMPTAAGTTHLGYDLTATMEAVSAGTSCTAIEGRIEVDDVTATEITGGLFVNCGPGNTVDGRFTAPICP